MEPEEIIEAFHETINNLGVADPNANQWTHIQVDHSIENGAEFREQVRESLKAAGLSDTGGIYVYKQGDTVLYIGKARSFYGRLNDHYREAAGTHNTAPLRYLEFFGDPDRRTTLSVHLLKIHSNANPEAAEAARVIVEQLLHLEHPTVLG